MTIPRTFDNTALALIEFDRTKPERQKLWDTAQTNKDVDAAEAVDLAALQKVQQAFWEDSKDINSRANCTRVDLAFMCQMARYVPSVADTEDPIEQPAP